MSVQRRTILLAALGAAMAAAGGAWWSMGPYAQLRQNVRRALLIAGAGSMLELNRALAKAFSLSHPQLDIIVEQGGSLPGLIALKRGAIDIAAMSRELSDVEDQALTRSFLIAKNEIAIAVHPESPLRALSSAQIRQIFSGQIKQWRDVSTMRGPIHLISRKKGSSSRQFMQDVVLGGEEIGLIAEEVETAAAVAERIGGDRFAVGFIALKDRNATPLNYLAIDDVPPTRETVLSGRYPFTQPLYLVIHGTDNALAGAFIDYALSPAGQEIVNQQKLIAVA